MNGEVCCILGVCCPPNSEKQIDALAREIRKAVPTPFEAEASNADHPRQIATWLLQHFDLAPAGTLAAFKDQIAALAREKRT